MSENPTTRRRLLRAAPLAASAALLPAGAWSGAAAAAAAAPRKRASVTPLPPPLAPDVFRARQERLRSELVRAGLDAVLIVPSTNLHYVSGLDTGRSERLMALLVKRTGPSVFVTPAFEEERARRDTVADDFVTWREEEDPMRYAASALKGAARIGIEGSTDFHTATRLAEATRAATVDATSIFDTLRGVKTPAELALIRDAAARTERAIAATHARLAEGMTERQIAEILEEEFRAELVRGGGLVQVGASAALPHGGPRDAVLTKGKVLLVDAGCKVRGYASDITRTVSFGRPSDETRKVYDTVDAAQRAGLAAFRAGAVPEEVDRAARRVIEGAGYGKFFTHRLGHGLGMDGHETPYLVGGNRQPLVAGNVCTIEPGIYLPGKLGVRIEDDYAATADGAEHLSARPKELVVIGA